MHVAQLAEWSRPKQTRSPQFKSIRPQKNSLRDLLLTDEMTKIKKKGHLKLPLRVNFRLLHFIVAQTNVSIGREPRSSGYG